MSNEPGNKNQQGMEKYFFRASAADFKKIPGSPIAYWVSKRIYDVFRCGAPLKTIGKAVVGLQTGENSRFVRTWQEVSWKDMEIGIPSREEAQQSEKSGFHTIKAAIFAGGMEIRNIIL